MLKRCPPLQNVALIKTIECYRTFANTDLSESLSQRSASWKTRDFPLSLCTRTRLSGILDGPEMLTFCSNILISDNSITIDCIYLWTRHKITGKYKCAYFQANQTHNQKSKIPTRRKCHTHTLENHLLTVCGLVCIHGWMLLTRFFNWINASRNYNIFLLTHL